MLECLSQTKERRDGASTMRPVLKALRRHWKAPVFYACLLICGWLVADFVRDFALPDLSVMTEPTMHRLIVLAVLAYILTAALPFVPGAEIGFALLLLFGAQVAPVVYAGMVGALTLSYVMSRLVPPQRVTGALRMLGLPDFADLVETLRNTPPEARAAWMAGQLPGRIAPLALRNRYLLLIALINTPGNSLLGGGGGIAVLAGASGLFSPLRYLACVTVAVAPVPLLFVLLG